MWHTDFLDLPMQGTVTKLRCRPTSHTLKVAVGSSFLANTGSVLISVGYIEAFETTDPHLLPLDS